MDSSHHCGEFTCKQTTPLRAIATHNVITLEERATVGEAARLMADRGISSILVRDGKGKAVGIITERTILHAMGSGFSPATPLPGVMSSPVISVPEHMTCQDASLFCLRKGIRHLALVDDKGRLTGVVTETDFRLHMSLTLLTGRRPVSSVMTRTVLSLPPEASLQQAVALMEERREECVVVLKDNRPLGIVTERDLVRLYGRENGEVASTIGEVMSSPVLKVTVNGTLNVAANRMLDARVRHLVVVDKNGDLAGLISEHNLTRDMVQGLIDDKIDAERVFLRTLIDTIPDLIWLKDAQGVYLACNARFEQFFGATEAEIIGKTDYDFVDRDLADTFREHDRQAMAKDSLNVNEEWITFANDGHRELLETIKTPMRDHQGRLIGVLSIGRNITAARQASEELRDSKKKLRTLIDAIPDVVQFKDSEGRWLAYNRTAARAFALENVDCHGKSDAELAELSDARHREALLHCMETDREALRSSAITRFESAIEQQDGVVNYFEVTKIPLFQPGGQPKGLVILAHDVTESRRMTRALQQSLQDFNNLVIRIPVGVFKFRTQADGGRRFDYVSPRWCEMVDLTAEEAYRDGAAWFNRIPLEDLERLLGVIDSAIADRAPFAWEGRLINRTGARWLHIAATPVPLENGDIVWEGIQHDITDRKQSEQRLALVDFALNHINDAAYLVDEEGRFHYVNDEACRALGRNRDQLLGLHVLDVDRLRSQDDWLAAWERVRQCGSLTFESQHETKDGRAFPVETRASYFEYLGRPYILGLARDISERKKTEEELRLAASVFTSTHEGIVITDASGRIVETNMAFTRITGYPRHEVLGKNPSLLKSGYQEAKYYRAMWQALEQNGHWSGEMWNRRRDGSTYAQHLTISVVSDEKGVLTHYVGVFTDITEKKEHQQQLEKIAHYDALTGVPNRVLLTDRLNQAIAQTVRAGTMMAVCFLDLDGFKPVNDQLGHKAGDLVLVEMARRMKGALRGGDSIARIGGDEFVLLLLGLHQMEECEGALHRIQEAINRPLCIADTLISLSASIGVTLFPSDNADADTLLRHADQAMYKAKETGKNRYHLFDPEQDRRIMAHRECQQRLEKALARNEFILHYQPKVVMNSGKVIGAEALIRWQQPTGDPLLPDEFLPAVKGTHLETAIGEWVLDTALGQLATWQEQGFNLAVSVNIDAEQLLQADFPERLQALLDRYPRVPAKNLELEILDSAAITDTAQAARMLTACRKLGVRFALDDFGASSYFASFRDLPVGTLKIARGFMHGLLDDPEDLGIVESVTQLARAFNRSVIAVGVETDTHFAMIARLDCHAGQGFSIAPSMPPEQLPGWVARWSEQYLWRKMASLPLPLRTNHLVLKTAIESHRKWVDDLVGSLADPEGHSGPAIDSHQCRFGLWYHGSGTIRYGHLTEFADLLPLHEQIHGLAAELLDLARHGFRQEAIHRLPELYFLRDQFVDNLENLIAVLKSL